MPRKTLAQVVRAAVVIAAIAAFQDLGVVHGHAVEHTARTTPRVQGNRLIQVNEIGTAVVEADGRLSAATQHQIGALICRYTYDGLGRLILKETPVSQSQTGLQVKNIYYDGVRRIQENITRPDLIEQLVMGGGGQPQEAEFAVAGEVANDELAVEIANAEPVEGGESPPQTLMAGGGGPEEVGEVWTDRQYVYGPDYVDEFVCQLDRSNNKFYMLQDANYNVVAILSPTGQVRTQYAYEPYGLLVAVEHPSGGNPQTPVNRVGHQGLFYERYDGDYSDLTIAQTNLGLYYNRNRFYSPMLGRFIQRDPNETALPILAALAMNGEALALLNQGFSLQSLYGNGLNLYAYLGSDPINRNDPLGLDWDPFEEIDDVISGINAEKAAWADAAWDFGFGVMRAGGIFLLESTLCAISPGFAFAMAVYGVGNSLESILTDGLSWGNGLGLVANAAGIRTSSLKFFGQYTKVRNLYARGARAAGWALHHVVPTHILQSLHPSVANHPAIRGVRGAPNRWEIPEDLHHALHNPPPGGGIWNNDWWTELRAVGGARRASVDDVIRIRDKLIRKYKLESVRRK